MAPQDVQRSGALDVACDLMQLSGLVRLAVRLVKGVEIRVVPAAGSSHAEMASFNMAVFSILPWFKVSDTCTIGTGQDMLASRKEMLPVLLTCMQCHLYAILLVHAHTPLPLTSIWPTSHACRFASGISSVANQAHGRGETYGEVIYMYNRDLMILQDNFG